MNDVEGFGRFLTPATFAMPEDLRRSAWSEHVPFALWLIGQLAPRSLVELGTFRGMSFLAFCQAIRDAGAPTQAFAVDTWRGDPQAGGLEESVYPELNALVTNKYGRFAHLLRSTFDDAVSEFADGSVDLLHIDGFHSYEAVSHDYRTWRPKLSPRAIVLFHDTHEFQPGFGVHRFWGEVRSEGRSFAFEHGHGLGVLALGRDYAPGLEALLEASTEETAFIRTVYARLGAGISERQKREELEERLARVTGHPAYRAARLLARKARAAVRGVARARRS